MMHSLANQRRLGMNSITRPFNVYLITHGVMYSKKAVDSIDYYAGNQLKNPGARICEGGGRKIWYMGNALQRLLPSHSSDNT